MTKRETVVKAIDVTVGYGSRIIQQDLNFEIHAGEIVCLMGGSGCGKSTVLKHLIGLYEPQKGDILINGESIVHASGEDKNRIMRTFGITYQGGALFGSMSVAENVELPLREYTDKNAAERQVIVEEKLEEVGLAGYGNFMPAELSGGMRKRAGLARALALDPKLLFFDEPSAGLDPISSAALDEMILSLQKRLDATIVLITHELDSVFTVADRVLMLDRETKTLVADGTPEYLRDNCSIPWVKNFLSRGGLRRKEA